MPIQGGQENHPSALRENRRPAMERSRAARTPSDRPAVRARPLARSPALAFYPEIRLPTPWRGRKDTVKRRLGNSLQTRLCSLSRARLVFTRGSLDSPLLSFLSYFFFPPRLLPLPSPLSFSLFPFLPILATRHEITTRRRRARGELTFQPWRGGGGRGGTFNKNPQARRNSNAVIFIRNIVIRQARLLCCAHSRDFESSCLANRVVVRRFSDERASHEADRGADPPPPPPPTLLRYPLYLTRKEYLGNV